VEGVTERRDPDQGVLSEEEELRRKVQHEALTLMAHVALVAGADPEGMRAHIDSGNLGRETRAELLAALADAEQLSHRGDPAE
jgi:hypothetical protein